MSFTVTGKDIIPSELIVCPENDFNLDSAFFNGYLIFSFSKSDFASTLHFAPVSSWKLIHSRRVVVSYKREYVHEVLVNCLFKLAQEQVWLGELTVPT